jgi:hypothetical protein
VGAQSLGIRVRMGGIRAQMEQEKMTGSSSSAVPALGQPRADQDGGDDQKGHR